MASISKLKNGTRAIQFTKDSKRKTVRLGKVTKRQSEAIRTKIEDLLSAKLSGNSPESDTSKWVKQLDDKIYDRLVRVDLVPPREKKTGSSTMAPFLDQFIEDNKHGVKPDTITTWTQTRRLLLEKFPADMLLKTFTTGHAIQWQSYLSSRAGMRVKKQTIRKNLSESTICRRCGCAKQIFDYAIDLKIIEKNPFASKRNKTTLPHRQARTRIQKRQSLGNLGNCRLICSVRRSARTTSGRNGN